MDQKEEMLLLITEGIEWEEAVIRRTHEDILAKISQSSVNDSDKKSLIGMLETIERESREHEAILNKWRLYFLGVEV